MGFQEIHLEERKRDSSTLTCKKCGKDVPRLFPKGWCEKCYIETTQALAEVVEKENQWQGRLVDKNGNEI